MEEIIKLIRNKPKLLNTFNEVNVIYYYLRHQEESEINPKTLPEFTSLCMYNLKHRLSCYCEKNNDKQLKKFIRENCYTIPQC